MDFSQVLPTHVRLQFRSDATYLLVGCLGGLGRCLASWMAERGAKHIAFLSRSGEDNPSAAALVTSIRALGVDVLVLRGDITSKEQIQTALKKIDLRFPIRGVVNAAVVLQVTAKNPGSTAVSRLTFHSVGLYVSEYEYWKLAKNRRSKGEGLSQPTRGLLASSRTRLLCHDELHRSNSWFHWPEQLCSRYDLCIMPRSRIAHRFLFLSHYI